MSMVLQDVPSPSDSPPDTSHPPSNVRRKIYVCIDLKGDFRHFLVTTRRIAKGLDAEVCLVHVIECANEMENLPTDPIAWELRRREVEARIREAANAAEPGGPPIAIRVLEGRPAEQICHLLADRPDDVIVFGRSGSDAGKCLGATAYRILERGKNPALIIPPATSSTTEDSLQHVLVALDGSPHSEATIPIALQIAEASSAELVLVHAIPEPALTHAGPSEPDDNQLVNRFLKRNKRVAKRYLDRQLGLLKNAKSPVRCVVLEGRDVRRALTSSPDMLNSGLLVLASHGQGGFGDVALGDVANFVVRYATIPVFLLRNHLHRASDHIFSATNSRDTRPPSTAVS